MRVSPRCLLMGLTICFAACSSSGATPDGAAPADSAGLMGVRIIRGDPTETRWFTFAIDGHGLTNDEGRVVTALIGAPSRPPERIGRGQVRIQDGAFRIEFPQGVEGFLYKPKLAYVDVDGDGICTIADRVYLDSRFLEADITLSLSDSVPAPDVDLQMLRATGDAAATNCQTLNEPLPAS